MTNWRLEIVKVREAALEYLVRVAEHPMPGVPVEGGTTDLPVASPGQAEEDAAAKLAILWEPGDTIEFRGTVYPDLSSATEAIRNQRADWA